jgi:ryanodine receptor 2
MERKCPESTKCVERKQGERMNMSAYAPEPVDLDDVVLDPMLGPLVEALAENVHDTWAKGRMDDGWTFGPVRDDAKKHHPCLVPYNELPESEKEYDRNTAISTLKFIVKKGYRISK